MPLDRQECQLAYREARLGHSRAAVLAAETLLLLAEARLRHARGATHLRPRVDSNAFTCRQYIAVRRVDPSCDVCLQLHGKLVHHASNRPCRAPTANTLFCNMIFFSVLLGRTKSYMYKVSIRSIRLTKSYVFRIHVFKAPHANMSARAVRRMRVSHRRPTPSSH